MSNYNKVVLMGNLVRDPETSTVGDDVQLTKFSIAVNRGFGSEEVDFFDVTTWRQTAKLVSAYKKKGDKVLIDGRLQLDRWETDGQKRSKVTVVADRVVFLPTSRENTNSNEAVGVGAGTGDDSSDIPF